MLYPKIKRTKRRTLMFQWFQPRQVFEWERIRCVVSFDIRSPGLHGSKGDTGTSRERFEIDFLRIDKSGEDND